MRILIAVEPDVEMMVLKLTWRVDKPGQFEAPLLSVGHLDPKYAGIPMTITEDQVEYVELTPASIDYYRDIVGREAP